MILHLTRNRRTADATFGDLTIDSTHICYSMERNSVIIPAGVYNIEFTFSPHFQRLMPLLDGVPNRTDVRIHPGNFPEQSEGCILVGTTEEPDALDTSKAAFDKLWNIIHSEHDLLILIDEAF